MQISTYKGSIQQKFIKAIFLLVCTVVLSGYVAFISWYVYNQKQNRIFLAQNVTKVLSQDFVRLILLDDINTATDLTTKLQAFKQIKKVVLYNKEKKTIFTYVTPEKIDTKELETTDKLYYHGEYYGKLDFTFKVESVLEIILNDLLVFILLLIFFLTISLLLARRYASHFSKPILYLVNFLEKIEFNEDTKRYNIENNHDDEIGKLYEEINFMFMKMDDFIEQKEKAQEQLSFIKQYDALTGLLNKNGLIKTLQKVLEKDDINWNIMFYIKLTNLKNINHAHGYQHGDLLLRKLAKNITENFFDSDLSARIGIGDFILYYQNMHSDKHSTLSKAQDIADALISILSNKIEIDGKNIQPEIHVGIDIFNHEQDPLKILQHTNIALEFGREKDQKVVYFDKENENYAKNAFNISEGLLIALKENQLELFYQPQYNKNNHIFALEALIRWRHPEFGLLTPYKFIPIAERTDLIIDIGDWVIEAVCKQLQKWKDDPHAKDWIISINVSAKQFHKDDFVANLHKKTKQYKIDPRKIKLELLESLFIEDQDKVAVKMHELKALNFKLSLDDFGTGFSSLQYLKIFPLDQIKIDQSFVMNMFNNEKDIKIIKSIIYLGSLLEMEVIAEGVEEKEHYEKLKELGCKYFQGYYFAKPQTVTQINSLN